MTDRTWNWMRTAHRLALAGVALAGTIPIAGCLDSPDDRPDDVAAPADAVASEAVAAFHSSLANPTRGLAPEGYLATPHGYFHPSCVVAIGADEHQRADGKIEQASGAVRAVPPCRFAHFDRRGVAIAPDAVVPATASLDHQPVHQPVVEPSGAQAAEPPPQINAWVMSSTDASNGAIQRISAAWTVPPAPAINGGQTIYYFPGLEDIENVQTIVQPVLGWSGGSWTIASWNCCKDGNVTHSSPVTVKAGDSLLGSAQGTSCDSAGQCPNWSIVTTDQTTNQSTTLNTVSFGQTFDWSFGAVLEVYAVDHCAQYPASGSATFRNIAVTKVDGAAANITWPSGSATASPNCGYTYTASGSSVTLTSTATTAVRPAAPTVCGQLTAGQGLTPGKQVNSCNGRFSLTMQLDGNLVMYEGTTPLWASNTFGSTGFSAIEQTDGNFVLYDMTGHPLFATGHNRVGNRLAIQDDGNLVLYSSTNAVLWTR